MSDERLPLSGLLREDRLVGELERREAYLARRRASRPHLARLFDHLRAGGDHRDLIAERTQKTVDELLDLVRDQYALSLFTARSLYAEEIRPYEGLFYGRPEDELIAAVQDWLDRQEPDYIDEVAPPPTPGAEA